MLRSRIVGEKAVIPPIVIPITSEKATYREYLDNYRLTIEMKCEGLDADQLARRSVPPSSLSLLGLVRHLAQMENHWFQRVLQGRTDLLRECIDGRTGQ